jgi:hypothetical protein
MEFLPPPGGQTAFEANADRAREHADRILAASMAEEAADERRSRTGADGPGRVRAFFDRIRSLLHTIRGD